jgi:hypothetical protein
MEDFEIKNLWKSCDDKLNQSLSLNYKNLQEIEKLKVKSALSKIRPMKIFVIVVGLLWVFLVDAYIIKAFTAEFFFFVVSAGIHSIITKLAIGIYIYHLILIDRIDNSESVIDAQEKLAKLQTSTLQVTRLLFLQLPVFTTFHLNKTMFYNGETLLWILQIFITGFFTFLGIWLFLNIKHENADKKWFQIIFRGREWNSVLKATEFLNQIEKFKKGKI